MCIRSIFPKRLNIKPAVLQGEEFLCDQNKCLVIQHASVPSLSVWETAEQMGKTHKRSSAGNICKTLLIFFFLLSNMSRLTHLLPSVPTFPPAFMILPSFSHACATMVLYSVTFSKTEIAVKPDEI